VSDHIHEHDHVDVIADVDGNDAVGVIDAVDVRAIRTSMRLGTPD
jgi:hypothetical protein